MSCLENDQKDLTFMRGGHYKLKCKLNSNVQITCGKQSVAFLITCHDKTNKAITYDLAQSENSTPVYRFVRTEKSLCGIDLKNNQTNFIWQRLSSGFSELFSGSKWQCGQLSLSQNPLRSLLMWIPRISWFIPTKYTITENGKRCGIVKGLIFSFSNGKSITVVNPLKAREILAAAIILSEDEIG